MKESLRETYREESRELLERLEKACLDLETTPENEKLVAEVFRALHTIKGSASMFGFDVIARFTHELESLYASIRDRKTPMSKKILELTLEAIDLVRALTGAALADEDVTRLFQDKREELLARLRSYAVPERAANGNRSLGSRIGETYAGKLATCRIRFRPPPDLFRKGINPEAMLKELAALGHCKYIALLDHIPKLKDFDPESCYIGWDILLTTTRGLEAIKDIFIFVEDQSSIRIDVLDVHDERDESGEVVYKRLGEILLERGEISREDLERALKTPKKLGEALTDSQTVEKQTILSALAEQEYMKELKRRKMTELAFSSIRVKSEKVDELINLVGELVTLQERFKTIALENGGGDLLLIVEENERIVEQLRNSAMSMRLLSLETIFGRFKRLVHDLSRELGKNVELAIDGSETELDKSVIERLNDPLVHLVRNCIDHGIETEAERLAAGKSRAGHLSIRARHAEANVWIEVSDDGRGLDRDAIISHARERGLVSAERTLSDQEIFSLIFLPGFSTAGKVTEISGRGVGMDVVKRTMESLSGQVTVESAAGRGTAVTLKIPLTLSIIEGLFVRVADEIFVIPMSAVLECVEIGGAAGESRERRHVLSVRGELLPYIRLREFFGIAGELPVFEKVVVVHSERRVGIAVDEVLGNAQVVIKSIGHVFARSEGVLGATVTGNGRVSLILDVMQITELARVEEAQRIRGGAVDG